MQFEACFNTSKFILTEGAIVERLKKEYGANASALGPEELYCILTGLQKQSCLDAVILSV